MLGSVAISVQFDQVRRTVAAVRLAAGAIRNGSRLRAEGTTILLEALRAEAPRRSGRLRDSIAVQADASGRRFFALSYSAFVVHGTRPHLILPRTRRALFWSGAGHPVRRVRHPGTTPNRFPERSVERSAPALRLLLLHDGRQLIRLMKGEAP